jgi:hypothetical protein
LRIAIPPGVLWFPGLDCESSGARLADSDAPVPPISDGGGRNAKFAREFGERAVFSRQRWLSESLIERKPGAFGNEVERTRSP